MNINLSNFSYIQRIDDYLCSPSFITNEKKEELKIIIREKFPIITLIEDEKNKAFKSLDKLISTKQGAELISRIIDHGKIIPINLNSSRSRSCEATDTISIQIKVSFFVAGINQNEEMEVYKISKAAVFAHELVHLLHKLEKINFSFSTHNLLHPQYESEKEQRMITGLQNISGKWIFDPLCENSVYRALGKKMYRVCHTGLTLDKNKDPTLPDIVCLVKTKFSIENFLTRAPEALNQAQITQFRLVKDKNIRPLTAAIVTESWEVYDFLLNQKNLDLVYEDDFLLGPFGLLLEKNEYKRALELAKNQNFNLHRSNLRGITPFMTLIDHVATLLPSNVDEQELVKKILQIAFEGIKLDTILYADGSSLLSRMSLNAFLIDFLNNQKIPIKVESAENRKKTICLFIEQLINEISLDLKTECDSDTFEDKINSNRYEKMFFLLSQSDALPHELKVKVLPYLAQGVVDFTRKWEDNQAKKSLEFIIKFGGIIKEEYRLDVERCLKGLTPDLTVFLKTDFLL
jgi:hypothetical protein